MYTCIHVRFIDISMQPLNICVYIYVVYAWPQKDYHIVTLGPGYTTVVDSLVFNAEKLGIPWRESHAFFR